MSEPNPTIPRLRCARCNGVFPAHETECPFCGASVESYGALGRFVEGLLPRDRGMTKVLSGLAVAVFLLVGLVAGSGAFLAPTTYTLIHFGAMFPPYVLEGEVWRLVTALFLHGGIIHIGFNVYALWSVGGLVENSYGKSRFLLAFVLTGVVSTLASLLWGLVAVDVAQAIPIPMLLDPAKATSFGTTSVGMSGAITGLIGVGVMGGHKVKNEVGTRVRNALLKWMGITVVFGLLVPGVDNAAHIGGFVAGLLLGLVLPLKSGAGRIGGYIFGGLSTVAGLAVVASLVLQGTTMPLQYPADVEAYPQGVFGMVIRAPNQDDGTFKESWKGCERAYGDLRSFADLKAADETIDRAVAACDEARYLRPIDPTGYVRSAYAYHLDGDDAEACRRVRSGRMLLEYRFGRADMGPADRASVSAVRRQFELVDSEAKCGGAAKGPTLDLPLPGPRESRPDR